MYYNYNEYSSSNRFVIPQVDSSLEFPIIKNDIIGIFYTGDIKETYPSTIDVSSIVFVGTEKEHPQVVMINGQCCIITQEKLIISQGVELWMERF